VVIEPTARHASVLRGLIEQTGTADNLTTDAHLAALAIEHGAEIVSFDRDLARFDVRLQLLS
jgi:predicted nucleic acid-binding protein